MLTSVNDTTASCRFFSCFSMGCNSGQPGKAWQWVKSTGVGTEGDCMDIGSGMTYRTYSLSPCAHHVAPSTEYPACSRFPFAIIDMLDSSCVTTVRRLQAGTINGSYPSFLTATDCFTQTLTNIAGAISIPVSTAIEAFNLFRPPNVHVDVCHYVWRPMCSTPRCVPNRPVEFPSTHSYLVDCIGVPQWSSALEVVRKR